MIKENKPKVSKPAIATTDVVLIKKTITYYLNNAFPVEEQEKTKMLSLFHRLGRL
jgi:hypothetical protein|tara:strand:+ start:576 stop:740 length:165 start_codon:yes stop_codon:yes gene_type:complete